MVHKFSARTTVGAVWLLHMWPLHLGFFLGILALFLMMDSGAWLATLVGMVAGYLAAIPIYWTRNRDANRRFALLGDQFLTLTESGVLVESPSAGARSFLPWLYVRRAMVKRDMLLLQQADGRVHLLPVGSMSREKVNAVLDYVRTHAGQNGGVPVPPPAALLTGSPMLSGSTPATRREWVDTLARLFNRVCLPFFYLILAAFCVELFIIYFFNVEVNVLPLGLALIFLVLILRPGLMHPRLWCRVETSQVHVTPEAVLTVSPAGNWQVIPTRHFKRALKTRRCIHYIAPGFPTIVSVDSSEPSPHLPSPRCGRAWPRILALLASMVGAPALAVGLLVALDTPVDYDADPSSLSPTLRNAYSRGAALAAEAESYMPPQTYPGFITGCVILAEGDSSIALGCEWESGLAIWLSLPQPSAEDEASTVK